VLRTRGAWLDRFEEHHRRELERELGIVETISDPSVKLQPIDPDDATHFVVSDSRKSSRRVIRSGA
jgi:hypothetical protein